MIERRETRACVACGEEIVPGQLYVPGGPLHVYCGAVPCPFADVCMTCPCADDDDVCFPDERAAAEGLTA